ncbi:M50 family metallopeptidase [Spiroplasma platyhelix]|uniref:Site-2 protease family protein n=1 Tax=Spiroplasma platyhelix PALS-1 TaxID=1276218 RepID=A0A846U0D1_9MOLU|nr:M50 family metallopeptidase [Spiroplasma platyhelix]MBE4703923.1 putative zinc metalloprotease [Spiroplasma platyhelix PALS-1]NKE38296.1 site-2 protease family protein [Spiroplasma platyhelix PALS-1]UJB29181.1 inner membrane zinc metalloprotease [Spiroplasma platyhelix PALS-1]
MIIFLSILIGLVTILFLITIHEFAHFIVAKLSGAYVYEFSIGMGPKLFQWGKKETRYTVRLLPLGGYVSIASEIVDPPKGREEETVEEKQLMENLHRGKKALFISAGALMNLLIAFILLMVGYAIFPYKQDLNLAPTFTNYGPVSEAVVQYNQEHEDNIIVDGDVIVKIKNINKIGSDANIANYYQLNDWIQKNNVKSDEKEPFIEITFSAGQIVSGIEPKSTDNYFLGVTASSQYLNAGQVIGSGFVDTFKNSYSVLQALGKMVTFQWGELSGPVGIIKSTSSFLDPNLSTQQSFSTFFRWTSLLSANLFLLNMIPIPPLDGYKFAENAVEAVTRKKLNPKFKIVVSIIGALLFLGIFIAITIKDIWF